MNNYPKIGIRPTIDGRQGGVRESLEEKTMSLAKAVAELISSNLRNGDGSPVECVIADSTIGRVAESAAAAEKFDDFKEAAAEKKAKKAPRRSVPAGIAFIKAGFNNTIVSIADARGGVIAWSSSSSMAWNFGSSAITSSAILSSFFTSFEYSSLHCSFVTENGMIPFGAHSLRSLS